MTTRHQYYEALKTRAREVRQEYSLDSPRVMRSDLRRIYRKEKIATCGRKVEQPAYFCDDPGTDARQRLAVEMTIFTLAHELKHHYVDRDVAVLL